MEQMLTLSLHIHMSVAIVLILSQFAFFLIKNEENFIKFSKKFRNLLLIQNILIGMVFFTGILVMATFKFSIWNIEIFLMIFLIVAIIVHQVLLYKKLRVIKSNEIKLQKSFKRYASKIYLSEAVAGVIVYIFARILE